MNSATLMIAFFIGVLAVLTSALPLYEDELQPYHLDPFYLQPYAQFSPYEELVQIRERRSPQYQSPPPNRGSIAVTGGHTQGQGGFVRGDYNHKIYESKNGARVEANTFYQKNWGGPGPNKDYGGGVSVSIPFKG